MSFLLWIRDLVVFLSLWALVYGCFEFLTSPRYDEGDQ